MLYSLALASLLFLDKNLIEGCPGPRTTARSAHDSNHDRALLVDGVDTVPGRFPYHVQVGCCSGALIAPDVVLTAAHDVPPINVVVGSKVSVGAYHTNQLQNPDGDDVQVRTVKAAFVHPEYTVIHNDFALLILDEPVEDPSLISLNRDPKVPKPKEEVTVLGTGTFNLQNIMERSTVLQEGETYYLPNSECSKAHDPARGVSYAGEFLDESNLCTMGGSDGCVFDSGGPIIEKGDEPDDDVLLALVSYGVDCADTVYPAVNARISAGAPWIDQVVCQNSVNPPSDFQCGSNSSSSSSSIGNNNSTQQLLSVSLQSDYTMISNHLSFRFSYLVFFGILGIATVFVGAINIMLQRKHLRDGLDSTIHATRAKEGHATESGECQQLLSNAQSNSTLALYCESQYK